MVVVVNRMREMQVELRRRLTREQRSPVAGCCAFHLNCERGTEKDTTLNGEERNLCMFESMAEGSFVLLCFEGKCD